MTRTPNRDVSASRSVQPMTALDPAARSSSQLVPAGAAASPEPPEMPTLGAPGRPLEFVRPASREHQSGLRNSYMPARPQSLRDSGLNLSHLCDLTLKLLYLQGTLTGFSVAGHLRLPFTVVDEGLRFLKDERCLEVASGQLLGRVSYRYMLTELGRSKAREAFEQCRYVGPAPVSLRAYQDQCRKQTVAGIECTAELLREAFGDAVITPELLNELGPAVCGGKSVFLYGPPGNGKSIVAKGLGKFLNTCGGEIFVPYSLLVDIAFVTIFDPTVHVTTDDAELQFTNVAERELAQPSGPTHEDSLDLRWRRIRRPVVVAGGELTLDMLDLRYNRVSNYYVAPLHLKANGGLFLIDDFGRQILSPRDLLNRWILPLEERSDFLTLATGRKFAVPFEQLIIFATNLEPQQLVDEAFLRRIRHKIHIGPPTLELYREIFRNSCRQREIGYDEASLQVLFDSHYNRHRHPRSSDPQDLLEIVQAICRFRGERPHLSRELLAEAAQRFFGGV